MSEIINDVSDTALWVAVYRARETKRANALFRDPLASVLAGERGEKIASKMTGSRYTEWSIIIRTCIIDAYIREMVKAGIDTVINLGCGLDTRPYRMDLPQTLRWIEVDFPHMIALKQSKLAEHRPTCRLERFAVDLSKFAETEKLFARIGAEGKKVLILTEGVTPYLSSEQVAQLAKALRQQKSFCNWIVDYNSPELMKYLRSPKRLRQMKNAPFVFEPNDWFEFYKDTGWRPKEMRYVGDESERLGRLIPIPWWARILTFIFRPKNAGAYKKFNAYALMEPC